MYACMYNVCVFIYLPIHLSTNLPTHSTIYLFPFLSLCLSGLPYIHLSVYPPIYPSIDVPTHSFKLAKTDMQQTH
jgi:hypothetical protein